MAKELTVEEAETVLNILRGRRCVICNQEVTTPSPLNVPYNISGPQFDGDKAQVEDACAWARNYACSCCGKILQHGEPTVRISPAKFCHYACWRTKNA